MFFVVTGLFLTSILRPIYVVWMKFAYILVWINMRVILGLFFYVVLTPVGLVFRLLGKDLIDQKIDRAAPTYWKRREPQRLDASRYERLF